ncbi:precursor of CEP5-like [Neltuma alba]|uniref:precursor of CEP5-like n=1 Tax=Neltuma alba TaxID=207710 RepID=UPI0010A54BF8|nr:precursor of CEP5-like [Prosopis alba]
MAQNKLTISIIILALIFCQTFQSIHGIRNLVKSQGLQNQNGDLVTAKAYVPPPAPPSEAALGNHLDDFRPTSPGHSPGVGHSTHN